MTADSNITVVPPPTRAPSATVSSPTADFTQSEVNPSYPTAKSAHGREIDQKKVERLVWECYNSQMAASESERVSKGTPQTQQTLDEDYDLKGEARISLEETAQDWIHWMKDAIEKGVVP